MIRFIAREAATLACMIAFGGMLLIWAAYLSEIIR